MNDEHLPDDVLSRIGAARDRLFTAVFEFREALIDLWESLFPVITEAMSQREDTSEAVRSEWFHTPIPINCDEKMRKTLLDALRSYRERDSP